MSKLKQRFFVQPTTNSLKCCVDCSMSEQATDISGELGSGEVSPRLPLLPPVAYRGGLAAKKPADGRGVVQPESEKRMRLFQQRLERQVQDSMVMSNPKNSSSSSTTFGGAHSARAVVPLPPDMLAEAAAAAGGRSGGYKHRHGGGGGGSLQRTREPSFALSDADQHTANPSHHSQAARGGSLAWSDGAGNTSTTLIAVVPSPRSGLVQQQSHPSPRGSSVGSFGHDEAPIFVGHLPQSSAASGNDSSVPTDDLIAWLAAGGNESVSGNDLLLSGEGGKKVNRHALVKKLDSLADDAIARKQALGAASGGHVVAKQKAVQNQQGALSSSTSVVGGDGMAVSRTDDGTYVLSQHVTGYSKEQHIKYVESFVARNCAESRGFEARAEAHCKSLDAVCDLNPSLVNIYSTVKHFVKEVVQTVAAERKKHSDQLIYIKKATHAQQQKFYEDKFVKALAEKSEWQRRCTILTQELTEIKKSRDEDLMKVKETVLKAAEKVQEDDQEVQSMRSLVTTVFQVNRENELRVAQLQEVIIANHLALPLKLQFDNDDDPTTVRLKARIEARRARIGANTSGAQGAQAAGAGGLATVGSAVSLQRDVLGSHILRSSRASRAVSPVGADFNVKSSTVSPMMPTISPPNERDSDDGDGDSAGMRSQFVQPRLRDQVSIDFIAATKHEMELCRLSTQRVLVNCAQDSQSTYKLLVSSLTAENKKLKAELESVREAKDNLERFVHEKRFLDVARQQTQRDDAELAAAPGETLDEKRRAVLNRDGSPAKRQLVPLLPTLNVKAIPRPPPPDELPREQLTPRPMFPFEIQPSLGVDLRQSTARITEELSTVAINLKKQLDEMHVRVRRLASAVTWMDEYTVSHVAQHHDDGPLLPVAPTAVWDCCHHFLRTTVQPSVLNLKYTQHFTAFLVSKFLDTFAATREAARFARDAKMLAPRVLQPFERRYHSLLPLDASVEDVTASIDNVPIGYIVTQFVMNEVFAGEALRNSLSSDLMQSRHSTGKVMHRFLDAPVELEVAKVAYNFWYAARKYRDAEPLCGFFIEVVEGRLPIQAYDHMLSAQNRVLQRLQRMDPAKSGSLTYNQISTAVQGLFSDFSPDISRAAVFAVAQTLESKRISAVGSIGIVDVMSDERRTLAPPRKQPMSMNSPGGNTELLLATAALSSLPTAPMNPNLLLAGSSLLVRFLRRVVSLRCDAVYCHIEALAYGCVRESGAVAGMYLLQLSRLNLVLTTGGTEALEGTTTVATAAPPMPHTPLSGMGSSYGAGSLMMSSSVAGGLLTPPPHHDGASPHAAASPSGAGAPPGAQLLDATYRTPIALAPFNDLAASTATNIGGRVTSPLHRAGGAYDMSDDVPPFLHVGAVPTCIGNIVTGRQSLLTSPTTNFVELVQHVTSSIPKYNTNIHFAAPKEDDGRRGSFSGKGGGGKGQKKSGGGGGGAKGKSKSSQQQTMELVATNDQDWVEWYTFLYAMRTTAPTALLSDALFAADHTKLSGHTATNSAGSHADAQAPRPQ